jgi:hypothetical protein
MDHAGQGQESGGEVMILAIDPGTTESAYVLWDGKTILEHAKLENRHIHELYRMFELPDLVIEMVASYGMPVGREVFETCVWIGRFIGRYENICEKPVTLIVRNGVKMHLCHQTKGVNDSVIRQALIDRFGKPGTKKSQGLTYGLKADTWQAFALAVTAWDQMNGATL